MEQLTHHVEGQFNGQEATLTHACLLAANTRFRNDGRGRPLDSVFCERLRSSVQYESIHLNQYDTVRQLQTGLTAYFDFYNHEGLHPSGCNLFFPFRGPNIGTHHTLAGRRPSDLAKNQKLQKGVTLEHNRGETARPAPVRRSNHRARLPHDPARLVRRCRRRRRPRAVVD